LARIDDGGACFDDAYKRLIGQSSILLVFGYRFSNFTTGVDNHRWFKWLLRIISPEWLAHIIYKLKRPDSTVDFMSVEVSGVLPPLQICAISGSNCSGDIVGTLQYMAPEALQALADARSDVCSLGLTLYELLTLRPPFNETTSAGLLRQVSEYNPTRPRQLNPAIPRDLETVVLKAMARQPEQRYQSAAGLADDLRRFLDDRPIQARKVALIERSWRWSQRNRAIAGLLVAVAASVLLALVVVCIDLNRESQRRQGAEAATKQAEAAAQRAEAATQRAEANAALSLQALDEMFNEIASPDAFFLPGLGAASSRPEQPGRPGQRVESQEKAALLQSILKFYDRFAAENATNSKLRWDAARANYRIGDIQQRLGEIEKAQAAYDLSLSVAEKLNAEFPSNPDYTLFGRRWSRWQLHWKWWRRSWWSFQSGQPRPTTAKPDQHHHPAHSKPATAPD
jgi:tetratricopeptide (TPR) repeat protein